jgi:hypothetical protein
MHRSRVSLIVLTVSLLLLLGGRIGFFGAKDAAVVGLVEVKLGTPMVEAPVSTLHGLAVGSNGHQATQPASIDSISIITSVGQPIEWASRTPAAHRARLVTVDEQLLNFDADTLRVGEVISIELFDQQRLSAQITQSQIWGNGTLAVLADVRGDPHGYLALSSVGGVLRVIVTDAIQNKTYQLRYDANRGVHVLLDVDEAGSDVLNCANEEDHFEASPLADGVGAAPPAEGNPPESTVQGAEVETVVIDVLAIYTPAAKSLEGGLANMEANISQSLLLGNQVLGNSNTQVRINLVHSAEVNYAESSSSIYDLRAIKEFDGIIDEVHTLRDLYGADFVVFFIDTNSAGGQAYRPTSYERPDLAFCVVRSKQSDTTSYTTIHELGHNMGNGHSKTQRTQAYDSSFFSYAAGWQWDDAASTESIGYCSVMTYENFDSSGTKEYDRVPYFSNPEVLYDGNSTGDAVDGDAARVIRDGRTYFEAFRTSSITYPYEVFPHRNGFESSDLVWLQSPADDHNWTTDETDGTKSSNTGPSGAFADARYAYVEATSHEDETAILEVDFNFEALINPKISFHYQMFDDGFGEMGDLQLETSVDSGETWATQWSVSGNQGTAWLPAAVDLHAYAGQVVRLRFRAITGSGYRSDLAIDAILVEEGAQSDPPVNFNEWLSANYPEIVDSTPGGDPDGDGRNNFLEYALGLSPVVAELRGGPAAVYDKQTKTFIFSFTRGQETVRYKVHSVTDLESWSNPSLDWDSNTATDLVTVGETQNVIVDARVPMRFVRLDVSE